jgi:hypothetical protein
MVPQDWSSFNFRQGSRSRIVTQKLPTLATKYNEDFLAIS